MVPHRTAGPPFWGPGKADFCTVPPLVIGIKALEEGAIQSLPLREVLHSESVWG